MQGCTTYIQPLQGCVHLAKDGHRVVCTLQRLMQGCHKFAATLLQGCRNLEISIWVCSEVGGLACLECSPPEAIGCIIYQNHKFTAYLRKGLAYMVRMSIEMKSKILELQALFY